MTRPRALARPLAALLGALAAVAAGWFYLVDPVASAYRYTHPDRVPPCCRAPADLGLAAEDVTLHTAGGPDLRGWYVPGANGAAVILIHGLHGNRTQMLDVAQALHAHGYGALLFDVRAHGASDGALLTYGGPEAGDAVAAADYLAQRAGVEPGRIGALGFSLGAQLALEGAARSPAIAAVLADGPGFTAPADLPAPADWRDWLYLPHNAFFFRELADFSGVPEPAPLRAAVRAIAPRPLLLVCAGRPRGECARVRGYAADAGANAQLWEIPGAGHVEGFATGRAAYETRMVRFFDDALMR